MLKIRQQYLSQKIKKLFLQKQEHIRMVDIAEIKTIESLDEFLTKTDNSKNRFCGSEKSSTYQNQPCILGIDEAGRGPVLGPMVYGVLYCVKSEQNILKNLHCVDSKLLNTGKRDDIFKNILENSDTMGWFTKVISPKYISNEMLDSQKYSLNQISMDAAKELVKMVLDRGINVTDLYVDTIGPEETYRKVLLASFPTLNIVVEKKADLNFPVVSAASICAKVTRDHALDCWKFKEHFKYKVADFGSGYPNDPVTKKFLLEVQEEIFGFPELVRFSWSTAQKILDENAVTVKWIDDNDKQKNNAPDDKLSFWKERNLVKHFNDFSK